ncbi:acyl-protein synthetase [Methanoregula sp.]|uniref:LuxE/PaaK family acyltransferase n=1 Tax=Methanoregula sp. TaxID=2052170 RepID=UPI002369EFF3|nr:acyl-protein synthetase [Methanoregula sp.]MDD1687186.1 acyl-protein synthetase [Methanoregula sp.]
MMPCAEDDRSHSSRLRDILLSKEPYSESDAHKCETLMPILREQLKGARENNPQIDHFLTRQGIIVDDLQNLEEVPFMPVQMFKRFDLRTCPEQAIAKILQSSGTTGGTPSRIPLDKSTAMNQIRALKTILADYLGKNRKIFLVIDHEGINSPSMAFSARTAGVRGLSIYAKKTFYLLKEENGKLVLNLPVIRDVMEKYSQDDVYAFGFTYIIWTTFYEQVKKEGLRFSFKNFTLFHGGGWKKMQDLAVSKDEFSASIAAIFGAQPENILDFYGMAEQTGIIFVDCKEGHKHVPAFSQVIIRDPYTLQPCPPGKPGLIEVMSVLADSYYDQAVLTEDLGVLVGVDDCPCGRKGRYFRFVSRVEKAEVRGCGDTFRE